MKKKHEVEAIGLDEAYDTLSQEAFAIWMRLHLFTDEQLNSGRVYIASRTGYSESRINAILRELKLAGYLRFQPSDRPGHTTIITFAKVCKISGKNKFVNLRSVLLGDPLLAHEMGKLILPEPRPQDVLEDTSKRVMTSVVAQSVFDQGNDGPPFVQNQLVKAVADAVTGGGSEAEVINLFNTVKSKQEAGDVQGNLDILGDMAGPEDVTPDTPPTRPRRIKFLTLDGGIKPVPDDSHGSDPIGHFSSPKSGLDISRYSKKGRAKRDSALSKVKHPDVGKPIDWARLDQWGKPQITFSPSEAKREKMVALLTSDVRRLSPPEKKLRKEMESKLESEFVRMYERYRRMVLRERGRSKASYAVLGGERKYALKAAVACIVKGVTPRQVLEYWHAHIGDFADSKMPVPPLTFLSQPANIDTVVIDGMSSSHDAPPRSKKARTHSMHTMNDTSLLHPKFRKALMEAGFDLTGLNDSYLTTIQAYAIDIVSGAVKARLIPAKIRGMVKWAADNFYADVNVEDYI